MIHPFKDYDLIINTNALTMWDDTRLNPIPSNYILNKVLTGWGATYSEMRYGRDSIIILPHLCQIWSKHRKHELEFNTFPVTEKQRVRHIVEYLNKSKGKNKKFLCTPEGLGKLITAIKSTGANPFTEYFILLDEFHKVTLDVGYRVNMSQVMKHFFLFDNKTVISSTPIQPLDPRFDSFIKVKVEHEQSVKKDITLSFVNNLASGFRDYLQNYKGEKLFVFFNSLNGIHSLMRDNNLLDVTNVYCSVDGVKDFERLGFDNAFSEIEGITTAKFNMLTSSFYNGLDIEGLTVKPDVLILTDYKYFEYTLIDPNTDAYQILGRFRLGVNGNGGYATATHIINNRRNAVFLMPELAAKKVRQSQANYELLSELQSSATNPFLIEEVYEEALKRLEPYNKLIDEEGELDWFKVHNYIYAEQVKMCYGHELSSGISYYMTALFNITEKDKIYLPEEFGDMSKDMGRYTKDGIKWACEQFKANERYQGTEGADTFYFEMVKRFPLVAKAIDVLDYEEIERLGFSQSKIRKALIKHDIDNGRLSHGLIDLVYAEFEIGYSYELATIKRKLQSIFKMFQLPAKAKATAIADYYEFQTYFAHKKLESERVTVGKIRIEDESKQRYKSVRMVKLLRKKHAAISVYSTRAHKSV